MSVIRVKTETTGDIKTGEEPVPNASHALGSSGLHNFLFLFSVAALACLEVLQKKAQRPSLNSYTGQF